MKYTVEVRRDLESIGIRCRAVRRWYVNTRAKKRWGECRALGGGEFEIGISDRLLADAADEQALRNTIAHELLHTVEGCSGHRGLWRSLADKINRELPGYSVTRVTSAEEKGITEIPPAPRYRYALVCEGCGQTILRQKESKLIRSPNRYRCAKCGGKFRRIDPGK